MFINCKRIMVLVRRGIVESTPVIVFCHEFPLLQAIHGDENVTIVTDPDRIIAHSTEGLTKEQRASQIEKMLSSQEMDSAEEYNRLVERYGMHPEVSVPTVEYVHGRPNSQQWLTAMKEDLSESMDEETSKTKRGRPFKIDKTEQVSV